MCNNIPEKKIKYAMYKIPIIHFNILPPRYFDISIKSDEESIGSTFESTFESLFISSHYNFEDTMTMSFLF